MGEVATLIMELKMLADCGEQFNNHSMMGLQELNTIVQSMDFDDENSLHHADVVATIHKVLQRVRMRIRGNESQVAKQLKYTKEQVQILHDTYAGLWSSSD